MDKKFNKLQLNKKSIAKMNDAQLSTVKGGNNAIEQSETCNITCQSTGVTNVQTKP
jgi:natural product precursor